MCAFGHMDYREIHKFTLSFLCLNCSSGVPDTFSNEQGGECVLLVATCRCLSLLELEQSWLDSHPDLTDELYMFLLKMAA